MSRNGGVFVEKLPRLPVGVENFEDIRREHFYYVDKTGFIEQLLKEYGKVSLFTRPRRFGKTLNMSMLKAFFEVGTDPALFKGLKILKTSRGHPVGCPLLVVLEGWMKNEKGIEKQKLFRFGLSWPTLLNI